MRTFSEAARRSMAAVVIALLGGFAIGLVLGLGGGGEVDASKPGGSPAVSPSIAAPSPSERESPASQEAPSEGPTPCSGPRSILLVEILSSPAGESAFKDLLGAAETQPLQFSAEAIDDAEPELVERAATVDAMVLVLRLSEGDAQVRLVRSLAPVARRRLFVIMGGNRARVGEVQDLLESSGARYLVLERFNAGTAQLDERDRNEVEPFVVSNGLRPCEDTGEENDG